MRSSEVLGSLRQILNVTDYVRDIDRECLIQPRNSLIFPVPLCVLGRAVGRGLSVTL